MVFDNSQKCFNWLVSRKSDPVTLMPVGICVNVTVALT